MHIKYSNWMKHWDFILSDLICINLSLYLAFFCRYFLDTSAQSLDINMYLYRDYRLLALFASVMHFCIAFFMNYYSGVLRRGYFDEFKKVALHNLILFFAVMMYVFVLQMSDNYSRTVVIMSFVIDCILMYLMHVIIKVIILNRRDEKNRKTYTLLVSSKNLIDEALEELRDGSDQRYRFVGISILEEDFDREQVGGIPVVSTGQDVFEYACKHVIDDVILCVSSTQTEENTEIINKFLIMGITVQLKLDIILQGSYNILFSHINKANVAIISNNNVHIAQLFLKRLLDIFAGLIGCAVTAFLYIFVAPAIKIADPKGPVFFRQQRVGRNGRIFNIYKFRSMYSDAEERKAELMEQNKMRGLMFKLDADPRIIGSGPDGTKKGLGHFLRVTSIDEFPNFWSILKGDMSLVGTRPPTIDEYRQYKLHHKSRLAAKPGLTGLWQVSGRSNVTDFEEIVKLDNEYIQNWNIGKDIKIILKTVWVVLTGRGSQ